MVQCGQFRLASDEAGQWSGKAWHARSRGRGWLIEDGVLAQHVLVQTLQGWTGLDAEPVAQFSSGGGVGGDGVPKRRARD